MSKRKLERLQDKILGNKQIIFHKGKEPLSEDYFTISIIIYDKFNNGKLMSYEGKVITYYLFSKHYEKCKDLDVIATEEYAIKHAYFIRAW